MTELNLSLIERQSVQTLPQVDTKSGVVETSFWGWSTQRGAILPAWGTRERERWLRLYDRNENNTLWQGASGGLIKKIKATPFELKGGRNLTSRFDGVLRESQFGAGWGMFLSLMLRDYLRFDGGAYAEIIAPGNPLRAPTGAVTGLAHLDSYRCFPTGDPEYPVVYWSRGNRKRAAQLHVMHHARILHLIDMPDGDQDHPGYGLCALSRAIAIVQRQLLVNPYITANLDDKPSPGVVIANNISKQERDLIFATYRGDQNVDTPPEWGKVAWVFNVDPKNPATMENFSFARPPEKFDYPVYVQLDINELALALGVDKQELWELSGATGTAGQSAVQHAKSQGKAYGEILASLEREINNHLLPDSLEFEWKVRDPYDAQEKATTAGLWAAFVSSAGSKISLEEARQILANQVEAVADAILDENGELIRLSDADVATPNIVQQVTAPDGTPNAEAPAPGQPASAQQTTTSDNAPNAKKDFQRGAYITQIRQYMAELRTYGQEKVA